MNSFRPIEGTPGLLRVESNDSMREGLRGSTPLKMQRNDMLYSPRPQRLVHAHAR